MSSISPRAAKVVQTFKDYSAVMDGKSWRTLSLQLTSKQDPWSNGQGSKMSDFLWKCRHQMHPWLLATVEGGVVAPSVSEVH